MTRLKLLFIPFVVGMGIGLFSCNTFDGGNRQVVTSLAVVGYESKTFHTSISTPYGEFVAQELDLKVSEGDCIYAQYTIDYDNQPSTEYTVATELQYQPIGQNPVEVWWDIDPEDPDALTDYTVPLSKVEHEASPYYKGKFFIGMNFSLGTGQTPDYQLFCNPDEADEKGTRTLYLQAKLSGAATSTPQEVSDIHAFDMNELFYRFSRDTTLNVSNNGEVSFRYIRVNLKYFTGVKDGKRSYGNASEQPINIYRFKD